MNIIVTAALAFFFVIGLGLAAAGGIRAAWRGLGRRRGVSAALAAFAVIATICAQKPGPSGPTITVDTLLRDAGCYATNDVFHAAVSNAPAYAAINFSACPVLVYARERGQTAAADWFELTPRRTFSGLPADYAIANATNYNYMVYLDYVPPSPVHTNGVFELHGFVIPGYEPGNLEQLSAGFINSRATPPPYDAEVEYLESTGEQWIDTGIIPTSSTIVSGEFRQHTQHSNWRGLLGSGADARSGDCFSIGLRYNNGSVEYFIAGLANQYVFTANNERFLLEMSISRVRVVRNGIEYVKNTGKTSLSTSSRSINIFRANNGDPNLASPCSYDCFGFKIYDGATLVRDYIAVRKSGVGYLYDRVSEQLFGNAGTGAFGVGPDK